MAETTVPKLIDAKDPDAVKLWADKVFIALQDLLGGGIGASSVGINSIQRGTITISGATATATATITAVDVDKTELRILGQYHNQSTEAFKAYLTLTNSTTITATRGTASSGTTVISWELTEYE